MRYPNPSSEYNGPPILENLEDFTRYPVADSDYKRVLDTDPSDWQMLMGFDYRCFKIDVFE